MLAVAAALGCAPASDGSEDGNVVASTTSDSGDPADTADVVVVLTFDDGPLDAEILRTEVPDHDRAQALASLDAILGTLEERELQAVFFVEGPGTPAVEAASADTYAEGLHLVADAGHLLGYHAYDHTPAMWQGVARPDAAVVAADMDALEGWIEQLVPDVEMAPLYRQPYGGVGPIGGVGREEASRRAWTYRGFYIDAADWTANATADDDFIDLLPVGCESAAVAYVLEQIGEGIERTSGTAMLDVVFHVNGLTARNLDTFLDGIEADYAARGLEVAFAVSPEYLETDDPTVDLSVTDDVGRGDEGQCD